MRRKPDPRDATIAALQEALDRAHARIRALEANAEVMAERMAAATERGDRAERMVIEMQEAAAQRRRIAALLGAAG